MWRPSAQKCRCESMREAAAFENLEGATLSTNANALDNQGLLCNQLTII
jgi:hypothetical protein